MKFRIRAGVRLVTWAVGAAAATVAGSASAITLGQADSFESGSTDGWSTGLNSPVPVTAPPDGGPGGAGDGYLAMASLGGQGPGSRLVAFGSTAWNGNYLAAGVTGIRADLNNFGSNDLHLRFSVSDPNPGGGQAIMSNAVLLPAGSGWISALFSLAPADLSGQPAAALGNVGLLRLFHSTTPVFPGEAVAAQLGIDNVSAVPEPGAAGLLALGLALLAAGLRHRRGAGPQESRR